MNKLIITYWVLSAVHSYFMYEKYGFMMWFYYMMAHTLTCGILWYWNNKKPPPNDIDDFYKLN